VTKSGDLGEVQPVPVARVLVIPVYKNYSEEGKLYLSIAHPFVYKQGDDLEETLVALGRREHLQKLVFWIPGYFPVWIPRSFRLSGDVNGKRMVVVEVQRCIGQEENQLNSAMNTLLARKSFVVQEVVSRKPPPYSHAVTLTKEPYDFRRLVESLGYQSRHFKYGTAKDYYLWGTTVGTPIVNQFSASEKEAVANFFEEVTKKAAEHSPKNEKATTPKKAKLDHPNAPPSPPANAGPRN
jgi:hypothetical protein